MGRPRGVWTLLLLPLLGGVADAQPRGLEPTLARYKDGHEALAAGEFALARARFEAMPADSLLGDYAAFYAAESLLRAGEVSLALERYRALPDRFPDSTLVPQAMAAAADTAFWLGRWAEAERDARRFLSRAPHHPEAGRLLVRLAEARAAQGLVADAVADLRRRWIEAPATPWAEAAREILEDLAAAHGLAVPPPTAEEQLLRAQRLADASELSAAARVLEELLAQAPEPALRHRALVRLAPALGRLQRAADGVSLLQGALGEPVTPSRAALLYELARLHRRLGQSSAAVEVLDRLLKEQPESHLVPEAWLALARTRLELGQRDLARETFHIVLRAHHDSPAAAAAGWEAAWLEYRGRQFREAALAFRQLSNAAPSSRLAGLYWTARALEMVPERATAAALYRDLVARAPNTYYGILAARRVRGGALPGPIATPVKLAADPLAPLEPDRHFQKGRALWRLGFEGHAVVELESLARDALVDADRSWSLAVAFAQIGEAGRSLRFLRRAFGAAAEAGAPGLTLQFWRLFYPFGYADHVRESARRAGLDPFFVAAVIREESSYDPRARSWVGAVGLMQLMPDTARVVAADAGVRLVEPVGLWEPPVNIALGAHYLAQLRTRFQEPLLAVAGYNAGPHRVQRWLTDYPKADIEEFVDQIPFDETRAFVKRVCASWHQYRRLYGDQPPGRGAAEAAASRVLC